MENPREKAYSFSYCLFAYIYKDIHKKINLPIIVDYSVPSTKLFKSDIGECILQVCRVHSKFLNPIFSKIFPSICLSETYFFEYVRWYYEKVACSFTEEFYHLYIKCNFEANPVGPFFIKFLTLCSFISEIIRYCFDKNCYNFTSSGPTSLAEIILTIPEFNEYFPNLTDAFIVLNRFCFDVMNDAAINANSLCDLFLKQTEILHENSSLSLLKSSLPILTLPSSTEITSKQPCIQNAIRQSNKRKSDVLIDRNSNDSILYKSEDIDFFIAKNPDSEVDYEKCKITNTTNFPKYVTDYESNSSSESVLSSGKRCPHCKEICQAYLEEFVDDFKETNYEDE